MQSTKYEGLKHKHLDILNREVADDITLLELSFLLETTNNVFYSILMNFEHIVSVIPSVN